MSKEEKTYPKHIGIILDGNRRWAKKRGLLPWEGHKKGAEKWKDLKKWMLDLDIKERTLYCLSMQNLERDKQEVHYLLGVFTTVFEDLLQDPDIIREEVKINHIGRIELLPAKLQRIIKKAMEMTRDFKKHIVNFAMAYGGQEEIIDAVKKICKEKIEAKKITCESFKQYLYLSSCPDLIIRTSGEVRTSNFLCYQAAYAEWFFPKVLWPDFTKTDLSNIIDEYLGKRERRFGK